MPRTTHQHTTEPAPAPASHRRNWKMILDDVGHLDGGDEAVVVTPKENEDQAALIRRVHAVVSYYQPPFRVSTYRTKDGRVAIQKAK